MGASICREAEMAIHHLRVHEDIKEAVPDKSVAETVCCGAVLASYEQRARALVVLSNSGTTARLVAKYRPGCPVVSVIGSSNFRTARQLKITRGVDAAVYNDDEGKQSTEVRVACGVAYAKQKYGLDVGDIIIAVHADAMGLGFANLTRILTIPAE